MSEEAIHLPIGLTTQGLLGRHYMARLIDSVIILLIIAAIVLIEAVIVSGRSSHAWILPMVAFVVLVVWVGYSAVLESSPWQGTVGKRLFKVGVYNQQGGRITLKQAAARSLVKDGPLILFAFVPGTQLLTWLYLCAHLVVMHRSSDYQAIHDRVAGTWVAAPESLTQLRLSQGVRRVYAQADV